MVNNEEMTPTITNQNTPTRKNDINDQIYSISVKSSMANIHDLVWNPSTLLDRPLRPNSIDQRN